MATYQGLILDTPHGAPAPKPEVMKELIKVKFNLEQLTKKHIIAIHEQYGNHIKLSYDWQGEEWTIEHFYWSGPSYTKAQIDAMAYEAGLDEHEKWDEERRFEHSQL